MAASAFEVWYFPGWMRANEPQDGVLPALATCFPESKIVFKAWDGDRVWPKATENADLAAERFADEITALDCAERSNLVLVGHSLGGRIAARVSRRLGDRGLKVRETVLLGAAIPYRDADVEASGLGSELPVMAICNPQDVTLRYVYTVLGGENSPAFGANGALKRLENVREYVVPSTIVAETPIDRTWADIQAVKEICNHHALFYLECLRRIVGGEAMDEGVMVPQDFITVELPVMDIGVWWDVIDEYDGWKLERNKLTGHARILDPGKIRKAWGSLAVLKPAFEKIKR